MLAQLGDLLRLSLERKSVMKSAAQELSVLEPYLNISASLSAIGSRRVDVIRAARRHVPLFIPSRLGGERSAMAIDCRRRARPHRHLPPAAELHQASPPTAPGFPQNGFAKALACRHPDRLEQLYGRRRRRAEGNPEFGTEVVVRAARGTNDQR